jgi:hypothetical protein
MSSNFPCIESPATNLILSECLRLYGHSRVLPHDDAIELHAQRLIIDVFSCLPPNLLDMSGPWPSGLPSPTSEGGPLS